MFRPLLVPGIRPSIGRRRPLLPEFARSSGDWTGVTGGMPTAVDSRTEETTMTVRLRLTAQQARDRLAEADDPVDGTPDEPVVDEDRPEDLPAT
ncbi:hypothetical protein GCM10022243_09550 [Saccharothrix violaceirubra]